MSLVYNVSCLKLSDNSGKGVIYAPSDKGGSVLKVCHLLKFFFKYLS